MKKLLLLSLFITGLSNAQIVNIQDTLFKTALLTASASNTIAKDLSGNYFKIDANNDGEIQESEAMSTSYLDVSNVGIVNLTGIEAFNNLKYLDCKYNGINNLNLSQNLLLEVLNCSENNYDLTALDVSNNTSLISLNCEFNDLTILDLSNNVNLVYLNCESNDINSLDVGQCINLETLICHANNIGSLVVSNMPNLVELSCCVNPISSIDVTQNSMLQYLCTNDNPLTTLDVTQNTLLETLYCQDNLLTSLDLTQNPLLESLSCLSNSLINLDLSQNVELFDLTCQSNELTELDVTQNVNLQFLNCNFNQLTTLLVKNGRNETLNFLGNPNLVYICADEDQVANIQNQAAASVIVSSYCSFTPGGKYNTITGTVLFDADNNGCDASDSVALNVRIDINDGTEQGLAFANTSGNYTFYTQDGNFTLTPNIENPTWFNFSPPTVSIPFADNNNNTVTQDFCVTGVGVHPDLEIVILPVIIAQPGFDAEYQILFNNKGNQTLSGSINFTFDDMVLDFVSASILPDAQASGSFTWNYSDLLPFENRSINVVFNVNSPMETPAVNIGDVLNFTADINPVSGDETMSDNSFNYNQIIIGAFDPNDKICLEGDVVEPSMIGNYLHYVINFENTGTAAATFVVVIDEIDETQFDMYTFQLMYASHPMETQIAGNKVEFIFDNINLGPDEKGNVVFKIKTLNTLSTGDSVTNRADIFFDYNFPIVTNDAVTSFQTLSVGEFELDNSVKIFPNPSKNIVTIKSNTSIKSVEIYDLQGRIVTTKLMNKSNPTIDVASLNSGVYFLKISTEVGGKVEKLIKQ